MKIENISDYPALQHLGRALWKVGKARGAAILVGAGFSRNADRLNVSTPEPPLWHDIAATMQARIYPGERTSKSSLRLAEEFKAVLGEPALESLIRELVRDEEWLPGELHRKLVQLPWTDILTTNWDTLIERASFETLGQTYETVRCIGDIATTRAPRVVKLHGSLPSNRPFIISEEDYRTYPRVFAPFVNLVQQVLLENELCLLGFSGDDPNFLEWSGWVRDQLGASARRIHLVGALSLHPAQRRLLESRNVSVIDLTPVITSEDATKHRTAATLFLDYLAASKPRAQWDWPEQRKLVVQQTTALNATTQVLTLTTEELKEWETQRVSYPGWVICPPHIRAVMMSETIHALHRVKSCLDHVPSKDRGRLIFEVAWKMDTLFVPVVDWLRKPFRDILVDDACWTDSDARYFVAALLLRTAREERDEKAFAEWLAFCQSHVTSEADLGSQVLYERCLWARDELNFRELKKLVNDLDGRDVLWKFRRAALLCDLGDWRDARAVVNQGLRQIREQFYRDRDSIRIMSRLAWAQFLSRGLRSWMSDSQDEPAEESEILQLRFVETKSDPWETLQAIDLKIEQDLQRKIERDKTKEPQFDAGTYRDHSSTLHFGTWWPAAAIYDIWRISEVAGVPARCDHVILMAGRMERAEILTGYQYQDDSDFSRLLRVAHTGADDLVKSAFGRIQVASLSEERCAALRTLLNRGLDYALQQMTRREGFSDDFWSRRAAVYTEVLSRLSVRLGSNDALALFRKGLVYATDPRWKAMELFEPLKHLLQRSFSAILPAVRLTLITEVIGFPLPEEAGIASDLARDWPEPFEWLPKLLPEALATRPTLDTEFAVRVSALVEKTRSADPENRTRATLRLAYLYMAGALDVAEADQFGMALWARRKSEADLPTDTKLYSHMFILLPCPDKQAARSLLMARSHESSSADRIISLAGAARRRSDGSRGLVLTKEEALKLLRGLLDWRPQREPPLDLGGVRRENEASRQALGAALADAILPSLASKDLTPALVDECLALIEKDAAFSAIQAVPEFVRIDSSLEDSAVKLILQMIVSRDNDKAWASFNAVYRWIVMSQEGMLPVLPRRIIDSVVSIVEARREPGLLHALECSLQLHDASALTQLDRERLAAALGVIFLETDYSTQNQSDFQTTTITLVRAAVVKLADRLSRCEISDQRLSDLLARAQRDPMPEVRFAAETLQA